MNLCEFQVKGLKQIQAVTRTSGRGEGRKVVGKRTKIEKLSTIFKTASVTDLL